MDSRWIGPDEVRLPRVQSLPVLAAFILWTLLALPRTAAGAPLVEFHIAPGEATLTLNEFSRQANLQLLFDFLIVRGRLTRAVEGSFEPRDALRRMLANTGLTFDFVNERTLAVTPLRTASAAGTPAPAASGRTPSQTNTQTVARGSGSADPSLAVAAQLDTIRVTGTNLRGESPVGEHVLEFDRQAIDASGAPTVSDWLRTLPQVFGGGPTQDTRNIGPEAPTNSGYGTGINLRGLGARATLVLINGRRVAPGGTAGAFVDVSNIPLSAVERIDVLPDSASALYGADAVGGVVNFIMRENFTGSETTLSSGTGTQNSLRSYLFSQTLGKKSEEASGLLCVEFYRRDALPADKRKYAVSDLTAFGGGNFDTQFTHPGNLLAAGVIYALPKDQDGTHLSPAALVPGTFNLQNKYQDADILPAQKRWSLYTSGRQNLSDRLSVFSDILYSDRDAIERLGDPISAVQVPSSNPFYVNPTGGTDPVLVYYNFVRDLGAKTTEVTVKSTNATFGVDFDAGAAWKLSAYGGYAREHENENASGLINIAAAEVALADPNPATALNPFGDAYHNNPQTLKTLTSRYRYAMDSQLKTADVTADGPIRQLPGGAMKLALGVDRRDQFFGSQTPASFIAPESVVNLSRQTTAAFAEWVLPLFGTDNARPGLKKFELSAAARYENYSGFGHATTPKFSLLWAPTSGVALRSTWSKALRAPSLSDLDESQNIAVPQILPDARSPAGQVVALIWSGKNADLREERANSWTAGLDFKPDAIQNLSIELTWFDITFKDRIQDAAFSADVLNNPRYAGLVTFNPDPARIADICSHSMFFLGTQAGCLALGAQAIVDLRVHNVETLRTRGIDFNAKYEMPVHYGNLNLALDGTYLLKYDLAEGNGSPETDLLNTQNNPINLRLRASVAWTGPRLGSTAFVNFSNKYRDTASQPSRRISSWTTLDAQIRYRLAGTGWTTDTQIDLNVVNLFNRDPPFLNNQIVGIGYDEENADPYGRLVSLQIRKNW